MNKDELIKLGLTEAQVESIIKAHKEVISGNFITKHRFDEVNNELKAVKESVAERTKQIENLKKFEGDNKALIEKLSLLEETSKQKDDELQTKILLERKRNAIKLALLEDAEGKPFDAEMVLGLFNTDNIVVDEKTGQIISGYKEQNENIRKEKSFLFTPKPGTQAQQTTPQGWKPAGTTPPDGTKGQTTVDTSTAYGKQLAQTKLGMLGIKTETSK